MVAFCSYDAFMKNSSFIEKVDAKIQEKHLLNHSFYQAWNSGALKNETIREYAAQYFKHVSAFPRYLSSIHSNCDDIKVRIVALDCSDCLFSCLGNVTQNVILLKTIG